MNTIVFS